MIQALGKMTTTTKTTSPPKARKQRAQGGATYDWGYIQKVPRFRFLKPPEKLPTFVPPEHFAAMIHACRVAKLPNDIPNVSVPDWWRGLLVMLYMTGWRIGQPRDLRWEDVDLAAKKAISRAEHNKGRRDLETQLHPLIVKYLEPLAGSFNSLVFPWDHNNRTLWVEFACIQKAATLGDKSPMPKAGKNGRWYGFHDLRRGFATVNAASMNLFELQGLMQHQSLATTKGYVNMAGRLNKAVSNLFVPDLRSGETG
jgi:integrase